MDPGLLAPGGGLEGGFAPVVPGLPGIPGFCAVVVGLIAGLPDGLLPKVFVASVPAVLVGVLAAPAVGLIPGLILPPEGGCEGCLGPPDGRLFPQEFPEDHEPQGAMRTIVSEIAQVLRRGEGAEGGTHKIHLSA
mmetsp:Transcript_19771/g.37085  ORF Transcript_19771/g.37085 Transcript_19771/m.37085 type:complete len:135 (+) Transcript_19771:4346-4750(+)